MKKRYLLFLVSISWHLCFFSQGTSSLIRFTENKYQWDDFILYRAQLDGGALYLEKNTLTYGFYDKETYRSIHGNPKAKPVKEIKTTGFKVHFTGANPGVEIESSFPEKDYCNYFLGNDKSRWATDVKNYKKVLYRNLWAGIHLEAQGQENSVKYNFYVQPGSDVSFIQMSYEGVEKISLRRGQLEIKTSLNELIEHKPYAYQIIDGKEVEVVCAFVLKKNTVSFSFPKGYNKEYELVIDPVIVFSCQSGSLADNFGMTATYDEQGNLYSGGTAFGQGYPILNAYDSTYNGIVAYGMTDVVITKYDSSGLFLHYSTYIGGASSSEIVTSLIVDAQNNLYLYGATGSYDFPMTAQSYDNTFGGGDTITFMFNGTYFYKGTDIYVAKLSAGGNQLLASTYMGGSGNDGVNTNVISTYTLNYLGQGYIYTLTESKADSLQYNYGDQYRGEIQIDNLGNPVICSSSRSSDFPTANAIDNTLGGMQDVVVFKLNPNLSTLLWSTYIGGSNNDAGYALSIAANNETYFTGGTRSNDFPATNGSYQSSFGGGKADGYIGKISADGSTLMAATYFGTNNYDQSYFVQLDNNQNVYIYGQSLGNIPVINAGYSKPNSKQFVTKLDSNLSSIIYSTIIGNGNGQINISPAAFLVDCSENVYLSGWGGNIIYGPGLFNMPLTSNAYQTSDPDGYNFYLMVLSTNVQQLLYATYFGGSQSHEHVDGGTSRFDKKGIIYQSVCAGCGGNQDFPIYPTNAWPGTPGHPNHNTQNNNCNNGVFKFNFEYNAPKAVIQENYSSGCAPLTVQFTNNSTSYNQYYWDFGNGDTTSQVLNPIKTYTAPGTYTATLMVKGACIIGYDTTRTIITVYPSIDTNYNYSVTYDSCINRVTFTSTGTSTAGVNYNWNLGNGVTSTSTNPGTYTYSPGTYTTSLVVTSSQGCGADSVTKVLNFTIHPPQSYPDTALCLGQSVPLYAAGGVSYNWQPSIGLSNDTVYNPVASPTATTIYLVTITEYDGMGRTCLFYLSDTVIIHPKVTAVFNYSVNVCGNTLAFIDSSYTVVDDWSWSFGDSTYSTQQNPTHSYQQPGTYTVTLLANNQYDCPDSVSKPVYLAGFSPISVTHNSTVCKNSSIQLNASGGIAYQWVPSSGLSDPGIFNPVATPAATTIYTVYITQVSGSGDTCQSVLSTHITIPAYTNSVLTTYASPDTIIEGNSTQLGAYTSGGNIIWAPDYNLSNDTSLNPTASPHHTTTYGAYYIDPHGCKFPLSSVTVYVLVDDCNENTVFVPNTFTPNGDGKNDVLYARSNLVLDIEFHIYDRWGQQVFETNDITKGWDGIFNGMPAKPDVFGYYIKFKCNNGKESFKKGNITLIR